MFRRLGVCRGRCGSMSGSERAGRSSGVLLGEERLTEVALGVVRRVVGPFRQRWQRPEYFEAKAGVRVHRVELVGGFRRVSGVRGIRPALAAAARGARGHEADDAETRKAHEGELRGP
jgi:hypothetical protein